MFYFVTNLHFSGPTKTVMANPQSIVTSVSGLNATGNYVFSLTVGDEEGEKSSDDVTIIVNESELPRTCLNTFTYFWSPNVICLSKCYLLDSKQSWRLLETFSVQPPVADAGPDQVVHLPDDVIVLDGGNSRDEYGIKSCAWDRDSTSPASGVS